MPLAGAALWVGLAIGTSPEATPPRCPPGSTFQSVVSGPERHRIEYCSNDATGLKEGLSRSYRGDGTLASEENLRAGKPHGLARVYDDSGKNVAIEVVFDAGKQVSSRMTLTGLRNLATKINDRKQKEGKQTRMHVLDERRIRYEMPIGWMGSQLPESGDALRAFAINEGAMCGFLRSLPQLEYVELRYLDLNGDIHSEFQVAVQDCPKHPLSR
jgi:hypothetical protein